MNVMRTTTRGLLIGALLLAIGFLALTTLEWAWWAVFVGGVFAWAIAFKQDGKQVLSFPHKLWIAPVGVLIYFITSMGIGLIMGMLGFEWVSNPAAGHLGQIIWMLPFMLMGEELLGIGVLEGARSKGLSILTSSLLSALIFGLLHIPSYWDGSLISTVLHVLLLQGVARLIFNYIYIKTGRSIWGSWFTHMIVDLIALAL
ncbi:hypothetical protein PJK55_13550 [Exiguobacterium sp. MMG028]|uniref:CPBP family glutamic-type intramembrane protease n=1 Tax=Exiguobacterium sp. MMG028 TaxID=3021979 RepID=UPI0022FDDF15|nr:CPBP family glutamic-type intramembrane protease [Exiguobacterium sp. MMG028]MDA5561760.1 hypothetical protein [Exiguobacterium sp. MMG028]